MSMALHSSDSNVSVTRLSELQRLVYTLIFPARNFEDLKHQPRWLVPWLVLTICSLASNVVLLQKADVREFIRKQINNSSHAALFEQLPPAQQEQQLQLSAKISEIQIYAYPVISFIVAIIVAALLMATFNYILKSTISFQRSFAVISYSLLPLSISFLLLMLVVMYSSNPQHIDLANPLATSPAIFLNPTKSKFLYQFATGLDLFKIWVVCLIGLGFQVNSESRTLSRATAITVTFCFYLSWVLVLSALMSVF
jgi:Yip1 domain